MSDEWRIDVAADDADVQAKRLRMLAYVDGECGADERALFEAEMATDPTLADEVARERALRERLRAAYAPVLEEAAPERFAAWLAPPVAEVVDLASRRGDRASMLRARAPLFALAATVALVAFAVWSLRPPTGPVRMHDGDMIASDALARSLDRALASAPDADSAVVIGVTFRDGTGAVCRSFSMRDGSALAGLACRDAGRWRVDVLARAEASAGELRQAGADMPAAVQAGIDARLRGDALDADAERTARDQGWR